MVNRYPVALFHDRDRLKQGLLPAFKDVGHPCQRSTSRSSRLSGLRTGGSARKGGRALPEPAWMGDGNGVCPYYPCGLNDNGLLL